MTEEERLYEAYVNSIMYEWLGLRLGPSMRKVIDALYECNYLIDKFMSATTGGAPDGALFKCVTGYCRDTDDNLFKFTACLYRDMTQPHIETWNLGEEIELVPIAGY
jgi:hypothetical protein